MKGTTLLVWLIVVCLTLAACGGTSTQVEVPTRVSLVSSPEVIASEITGQSTPEVTRQIVPTQTDAPASSTPTSASSATPPPPTVTPAPSNTMPPPSPTVPPTENLPATAAAATEIQLSSPRFATLTPGGPLPEIPVIAADVTITSEQLRIALEQQLANSTRIEAVSLRFVTGDQPGVRVGLLAYGGEALTDGDVTIAFMLRDGFVAIQVVEVSVGSGSPPQPYLDVISTELYPALIAAFDGILTERLGPQHDLESIQFVENRMEITLLVPE